MMESLRIGRVSSRPANESDLHYMLDVYKLNFGAIVEEARGWDDAIEREFLLRQILEVPAHILLYDEQEAGFLSYEIYDSVHIRHIEVHPDFSGLGIGTLAIRWLTRMGGGKPIRVAVTEGNHRGMEFYTNIGFVKIGEIFLPMRGRLKDQLLRKTMMQLDIK